jgi:hypothetical protein
MAKKYTRHRSKKSYKRRINKTMKMKGGSYSQSEMQQLHNNGLNDEQIQILQELNISYNDVMDIINQLWNQGEDGFNGNSDDFAEQIMDHFTGIIPQNEDDIHDIDMSFNGDDSSLHLSDLNVTQDSMRANTTIADESFNNTQSSNNSVSSVFSENESIGTTYGGKKKHRNNKKYKTKKIKKPKQKKTKKCRNKINQRGGVCYGTGVGSNSYDPNYSIYNTRELELFPYKPN